MRLLLENTRAFNTDPESDWIVQHAQLLMEAAEEAVEARKSDLLYLEQYLEKPEKEVASVKEQDSQAAPLRSGKAAFAKLPKDTYIELYWPPDDQWYTGKVVDYSEEDKMHNIYYEADHSSEWVDLSEVKWKYATVERSAEKRSRTKTHGSTPRFHNNSNNIGYSAESKTTKRRKVEETPKKLSTPILTGGTVSSRKVAEDGLGASQMVVNKLEQMTREVTLEIRNGFEKIEHTLKELFNEQHHNEILESIHNDLSSLSNIRHALNEIGTNLKNSSSLHDTEKVATD